ncbi:hypothetical protein [Pseudomonas juntendi]|uniref:hypothetical protein n=1 Tax=Pseudomonas juntendi TaxID=2666183 RepID=UPI0024481F03|nr:hypothetical protein [Pseudomonas juntendi]MDG9887167.1 hypothetical protein [Pseudomonas juntendi]
MALMEKAVIELFMKQIAMKPGDQEAPMNEIRDRFDVAGIMIGRTLAMVDHKGPVGADLAMKVRRYEEHYRERCKRTARNMWGPDGWMRTNPAAG